MSTFVVVTGTSVWTVLPTWTIQNIEVKVTCTASKTEKICGSTRVYTDSVDFFEVFLTSQILRARMIIATGAESRGAVFTSGRTPWKTRAEIVAVYRVVDAVEIARGVAITVNQALLFNIVADVYTFVSQCIISESW